MVRVHVTEKISFVESHFTAMRACVALEKYTKKMMGSMRDTPTVADKDLIALDREFLTKMARADRPNGTPITKMLVESKRTCH